MKKFLFLVFIALLLTTISIKLYGLRGNKFSQWSQIVFKPDSQVICSADVVPGNIIHTMGTKTEPFRSHLQELFMVPQTAINRAIRDTGLIIFEGGYLRMWDGGKWVTIPAVPDTITTPSLQDYLRSDTVDTAFQSIWFEDTVFLTDGGADSSWLTQNGTYMIIYSDNVLILDPAVECSSNVTIVNDDAWFGSKGYRLLLDTDGDDSLRLITFRYDTLKVDSISSQLEWTGAGGIKGDSLELQNGGVIYNTHTDTLYFREACGNFSADLKVVDDFMCDSIKVRKLYAVASPYRPIFAVAKDSVAIHGTAGSGRIGVAGEAGDVGVYALCLTDTALLATSPQTYGAVIYSLDSTGAKIYSGKYGLVVEAKETQTPPQVTNNSYAIQSTAEDSFAGYFKAGWTAIYAEACSSGGRAGHFTGGDVYFANTITVVGKALFNDSVNLGDTADAIILAKGSFLEIFDPTDSDKFTIEDEGDTVKIASTNPIHLGDDDISGINKATMDTVDVDILVGICKTAQSFWLEGDSLFLSDGSADTNYIVNNGTNVLFGGDNTFIFGAGATIDLDGDITGCDSITATRFVGTANLADSAGKIDTTYAGLTTYLAANTLDSTEIAALNFANYAYADTFTVTQNIRSNKGSADTIFHMIWDSTGAVTDVATIMLLLDGTGMKDATQRFIQCDERGGVNRFYVDGAGNTYSSTNITAGGSVIAGSLIRADSYRGNSNTDVLFRQDESDEEMFIRTDNQTTGLSISANGNAGSDSVSGMFLTNTTLRLKALALTITPTVWKSRHIEITVPTKPAANPPAAGTEPNDNFPTLDFDKTTDEQIFFTQHVHEDYYAGDSMGLDILFFVDDGAVADTFVVWGLQYKMVSEDSVFNFSNTTTILDTVLIKSTNKQVHHSHLRFLGTNITTDTEMLFRLYRDANNAADNYDDGDARLTDCEYEFKSNKI